MDTDKKAESGKAGKRKHCVAASALGKSHGQSQMDTDKDEAKFAPVNT
jgi:hypothetical protein